MANRTVKDAHSVKGTNPQYLVEKIIRSRIYECRYWKEECFALTAELLVDKAMALKYIGGVFSGNVKPTPFLCLILKMLQIQPERDIIVEFIRNEDFKYVRALGAMYLRLVGSAIDCYKYLEPLYNDYRKIKQMDRQGEITLTHMDEFIDSLLREDRKCDVILPRLPKRVTLEEGNQLEPRVSALDEDLENLEESDEEILTRDVKRSPTPEKSRSGYRDLDRPDNRNTIPAYRRSKSPERREHRERRPDDRLQPEFSRRPDFDRPPDFYHRPDYNRRPDFDYRADVGRYQNFDRRPDFNRYPDFDRRPEFDRRPDFDRHPDFERRPEVTRTGREREKRHRSPQHRDKHRGDDDDESRRKKRKAHHEAGRERAPKVTVTRHKEHRSSRYDLEIREANDLRAELGMPPLR